MPSTSSYLLRQLPDTVKKIVLKKQYEMKIKKGIGQYSWESALYEIIKEWERAKPTQP